MMKKFELGRPPADNAPCVVALGGFDGMHIGHRRLLAETVRLAEEQHAQPCVFTFTDLSFKGMPQLLSADDRYAAMAAQGITRVCTANFDEARTLSPAAFFDKLARTVPLCGVVCGFNFHFGAGGAGTPEVLTALASAAGIPSVVVPPVVAEGVPVSATAVRRALCEGKPELAAVLLGAPYTLRGIVAHGKGLGHTLSFPTLNLPLDEKRLIPRHGVYVSVCRVAGQTLPAVSNIGLRPTVEQSTQPNCEAHLLAAAGNLYGKHAEVSLLHFLRPEQTFPDTEALARQIARDAEQATAWLAARDKPQNG